MGLLGKFIRDTFFVIGINARKDEMIVHNDEFYMLTSFKYRGNITDENFHLPIEKDDTFILYKRNIYEKIDNIVPGSILNTVKFVLRMDKNIKKNNSTYNHTKQVISSSFLPLPRTINMLENDHNYLICERDIIYNKDIIRRLDNLIS